MGGCETGRGEVGGVRDDCKQRGKWAVECSSRVLQPQMFDNRVELEYGLSRDSCRGPLCFRLGNSPGVMALKRVRDGGGVEDTSGYTNNASALFRQESRVKNVETKQNLRCNVDVQLYSLSIGLVSLSLHVVLYSFTLRETISIISTNRNR